jgi:hypothetical protein
MAVIGVYKIVNTARTARAVVPRTGQSTPNLPSQMPSTKTIPAAAVELAS